MGSEHWDISEELLTNHVKELLHKHVHSNPKKEPIKLLQRTTGQDGCKGAGPYKVGMHVIKCDGKGKLPTGLIWRDDLPPNLSYYEVNLRSCEPTDLVGHMMNGHSFDWKSMKDIFQKCIESIPDAKEDANAKDVIGLYPGLENAEEDDNNTTLIDLT